MPEYSEHGLNLRWSDPDILAPGADRRVLLDARPASPSNVMRIVYSINGGSEQIARGWQMAPEPGSDSQRFAADLPPVRPQDVLSWRPVLSNGIRSVDPGPQPASPRVDQAHEVTSRSNVKRFPYDLTFLARVNVPLERHPYAVGMTPDGLRIVFPLGEGGTVRGPSFNGKIDHVGGDWMRVRDDGIGVTDIHALIHTDDGATILSEYSGLVDFGPDGQKRLSDGNPPPEANIDLTPRYLTSHNNWTWLNRLQCVGFGRVTMSTLLVEYDLYAMGSRAVEASKKVDVNV